MSPSATPLSMALSAQTLFRQRDRSCYAAAGELKRLLADRRTLLIDVRNPAEFKRFRIPGSVRVALPALRTKLHWRDRPLLLANAGYGQGELETACRKLRSDGFKQVWILEGGLRYWRQTIGPLEGELAPQAQLNRIPPDVFTSERRFGHWLVVDVSQSEDATVAEWLPDAVAIPFAEDGPAGDHFLRSLAQVVRERRRARPDSYVLLVDVDASAYSRIERAIARLALPHALFLEGGISEYRDYWTRRAAILARRAGSEVPEGCDTP